MIEKHYVVGNGMLCWVAPEHEEVHRWVTSYREAQPYLYLDQAHKALQNNKGWGIPIDIYEVVTEIKKVDLSI
jgi:hypothetical protein